jgi:hypothetical protein
MDASSSTITIQLSDDADGYVIADAVRIVGLGPLTAFGGLTADTLSTGVRAAPDGVVPRVKPMPSQPLAAVSAADQVFAAMHLESAGDLLRAQTPARRKTTNRADRHSVFADVEELLSDPAEELVELLDDWLLRAHARIRRSDSASTF